MDKQVSLCNLTLNFIKNFTEIFGTVCSRINSLDFNFVDSSFSQKISYSLRKFSSVSTILRLLKSANAFFSRSYLEKKCIRQLG